MTLVLLREESSYGYELMERLEEEFGFEQIRAGTLYRTLSACLVRFMLLLLNA